MKDQYDFTNGKKRERPGKGKKAISVRLDMRALLWLEESAAKVGVGYQTFLNDFLIEQWEKSQAEDKELIEEIQTVEKAIKRIKKKVSA